MYHADSEPSPKLLPEVDGGTYLTPDPQIALQSGPFVSAFIIPSGRYLVIDSPPKDVCMIVKRLFRGKADCSDGLNFLHQLPNAFSSDLIEALHDNGYMGFIDGNYLFMFEPNMATFLGIYDRDTGAVIK